MLTQACSFSLLDPEENKTTCLTVQPIKPLSSYSYIEIKAGNSFTNSISNKEGLELLQTYDSTQRAIDRIWSE